MKKYTAPTLPVVSSSYGSSSELPSTRQMGSLTSPTPSSGSRIPGCYGLPIWMEFPLPRIGLGPHIQRWSRCCGACTEKSHQARPVRPSPQLPGQASVTEAPKHVLQKTKRRCNNSVPDFVRKSEGESRQSTGTRRLWENEEPRTEVETTEASARVSFHVGMHSQGR